MTEAELASYYARRDEGQRDLETSCAKTRKLNVAFKKGTSAALAKLGLPSTPKPEPLKRRF